jgi:ATP-binding cassette subfamily C protein
MLSEYSVYAIDTVRWRFGWVLGLMVVCSLTDGVSVSLLLPVLQAAGLDVGQEGEVAQYVNTISAAFRAAGLQPTLLLLLAAFVAVSGSRTLLGRVQSISIFATEQSLVQSLRQRLYSAITNANWLFLSRSRSTDFAHALTQEVMRVGQATHVLLTLAANLIVGVVYVVIALTLSWQVTVIMLGAGVLLVLLLRGRTSAIERSGGGLSTAMNRFYAGTIEHLQSLKTAKTYGAQERNIRLFSDFNREVTNAYVVLSRREMGAGAWFEAGSVIILCAMIYFAVEILHVPAAAILILLLLFSRLMPVFMSSYRLYGDLLGALPAFANTMDLVRKCEAAAEPEDTGGQSFQLRSAVVLQNISFTYGTAGSPAVHDLDMKIPFGKVVAIVGPSGAGKSTAVDLLMGLLTPDSGRIFVDAVTLTSQNARSWREQVGYVAQETPLFHLSVRDNLLWARPDANEADMMDALRLAAADAFVSALPGGMDTILGDRGTLVSQGERQRIALARALLCRPALLVLDEATNSLDTENEARVFDAIEHRREGQTVLIIAHRLSTIRHADLIYVLENGTVVESGSWQDLSGRSQGRFRALCDAQRLVA